MEIRVDLADMGAEQMWELFQKGLPSLQPEEIARRAKELGAEPLCRENAAERIFKAGLWTFWKNQTGEGESRFAVVVQADFLSMRTRLARLCVDTVSVIESKLLAIGETKGTDSPDYKSMQQFQDGAHMVIGLIDKLLQVVSEGVDPTVRDTKPAAPGKPKPKPKKKGARK
jgi:soluble cytochrome b562